MTILAFLTAGKSLSECKQTWHWPELWQFERHVICVSHTCFVHIFSGHKSVIWVYYEGYLPLKDAKTRPKLATAHVALHIENTPKIRDLNRAGCQCSYSPQNMAKSYQ